MAVRTERLLKITAAIADAVSSDQVFEALVDHVAEAVDASSVALWLVDEEKRTAQLARAHGYTEASAAALRNLPLDSAPSVPFLDSIRRAQPVWIASQAALLEQYPHLLASTTQGRSYRISCLPLIVRGEVVGTLALTIESVQPGSDDERDFLLLVARYASQAVERLRLFEAEHRSRAEADSAAQRMRMLYQETLEARTRAEQLSRFAQAVVTADRVEAAYEAALDASCTALGVTRSSVLTFDGQGRLRFRAFRNLSEHYRRASEGKSPWPQTESAPEPVLISDVLGDGRCADSLPLLRAEGIGALAFIPLVSRERLLGTLVIYHAEARSLSHVERETARTIGNHLASVMTRFSVVTKLEETIRLNELFAGALAHDLRTPMQSILMAAQILLTRREGEADADARPGKPVSRILSSGHRMVTMIDQLLDFTRVRGGGGIGIRPQETNLEEVCGHASDEIELTHPEWKISRETRGDLTGTWDPDRLLRVISNLVANAGQHGLSDRPIAIELDGTQPEHVCIRVRNEGTIAPGLLPHLFEPFRSSGQRRDRSLGLGLGLFIVRQIVRAHGGCIDVSSTEAQGTTFSVRLPRRPASAARK